jgi:segregation and condensation protein A
MLETARAGRDPHRFARILGPRMSDLSLEAAAAENADQRLARFRRHNPSLLPESWRVRLPVFEGPLDLLLHLVRIDEVEITDIPVALICDQFHEYLGLMEELDLDIAGEFIYEAAVLIQLKSALLLPRPAVGPGEEPPPDPRQDLVRRLLEYQRLREAAERLAEISSVRLGLWTRDARAATREQLEQEGDEIEMGDLSLFDLLRVFGRVMERFRREHPEPLLVRTEAFTVRAQIDRLLARLASGRPLELFDDLLALSCRGEAIAAFLAVLELTRLGAIRLARAGEAVLVFRTERDLLAAELEGISG